MMRFHHHHITFSSLGGAVSSRCNNMQKRHANDIRGEKKRIGIAVNKNTINVQYWDDEALKIEHDETVEIWTRVWKCTLSQSHKKLEQNWLGLFKMPPGNCWQCVQHQSQTFFLITSSTFLTNPTRHIWWWWWCSDHRRGRISVQKKERRDKQWVHNNLLCNSKKAKNVKTRICNINPDARSSKSSSATV